MTSKLTPRDAFQLQLDAIDRAAADLYAANAQEPYVHADYAAADRVYTSHLVVAFGAEMADRVRDMWADCQEDVRYCVAYLMQEDAWNAQSAAELAAEIRVENHAADLGRDAFTPAEIVALPWSLAKLWSCCRTRPAGYLVLVTNALTVVKSPACAACLSTYRRQNGAGWGAYQDEITPTPVVTTEEITGLLAPVGW